MKELSIEEKAKRYDETLAMAKECITYIPDEAVNKYMLNMFPELRESEEEKDARISKSIIRCLEGTMPDSAYRREYISWLEKQGKQKSIWHNEDEEPQRGSLILLIMQSGTPVVAKIIESNHTFNHGERWAYIDDLLEKQSEQKPQGKSALEAINEEKVDNTDKVEPKFKVGDWVIQGCNILRIRCVGDKCYCYETVGGYVDDMLVSEIDSLYHIWTIQDAKDGDVIANDHNILILKESVYDWYTNGTPYSVKAYCGIKPNGNFEIGIDNWSFCGTLHIHPATKEQRDLLFTKMKEKGYEWNADKKELIKL